MEENGSERTNNVQVYLSFNAEALLVYFPNTIAGTQTQTQN